MNALKQTLPGPIDGGCPMGHGRFNRLMAALLGLGLASGAQAVTLTTQYSNYNSLSQPQQITYPDGNVETRTYDSEGNPTSVTDIFGGVTSYGFIDGQLRSVSNPYGFDTSLTVAGDGNPFGFITGSTQSDGATSLIDSLLMDDNGFLTEYTRSVYGKTVYTRDKAGRPLTERKHVGTPQAHLIEYDYYPDGQPKQIKVNDGGSADVSYTVDFTVEMVGPGGGYQVVEQTVTYAGGTFTTTYAYDPLGRVKHTSQTSTGPGGASSVLTTTYAYTANVTDAAVAACSGGHCRTVAVTGPNGGVHTTTLDAEGNVVKTVMPRGETTLYEYNQLGWLTAKVESAATLDSSIKTVWTHDWHRGARFLRTDYGHDSQGRVISTITARDNGSGVRTAESYAGYDSKGRLTWTRVGDAATGIRKVYTYNDKERMNAVYELSGGEGSSTAGYQRKSTASL